MKEAIQYFGKKYHNNPEIYYLGGKALPEIVKDVVYDMFVEYTNFQNASPQEYKYMKNIYQYCIELKEKGFVNLENFKS